MNMTDPWFALAVVLGITLVTMGALWIRAQLRTVCDRCHYPKHRCTCEDRDAGDVLEA